MTIVLLKERPDLQWIYQGGVSGVGQGGGGGKLGGGEAILVGQLPGSSSRWGSVCCHHPIDN